MISLETYCSFFNHWIYKIICIFKGVFTISEGFFYFLIFFWSLKSTQIFLCIYGFSPGYTTKDCKAGLIHWLYSSKDHQEALFLIFHKDIIPAMSQTSSGLTFYLYHHFKALTECYSSNSCDEIAFFFPLRPRVSPIFLAHFILFLWTYQKYICRIASMLAKGLLVRFWDDVWVSIILLPDLGVLKSFWARLC